MSIKYFNVETWMLFAPPIEISGYAPGSISWTRGPKLKKHLNTW